MEKEKTRLKRKHEQEGFVLILGIIVMAFLLLLMAPFLFQLSNQHQSTERASRHITAFSLAEAGIERAIWELNHGDITSWSGDSSARVMTISDFQSSEGNVVGSIDIKIINPDTENPVIEATGKVAGAAPVKTMRTAQVVLKRGDPPPLFDYAVFGKETIDVNSNALVDSYDSSKGNYGGTNVGFDGNVGTNSDAYGSIDLAANAKIYGSAYTGPESDPATAIITRSNALITGDRGALSEPKEMPSVTPPEDLTYRGAYDLSGTNIDTISESGQYASFNLRSNAKVRITGDVTLYVTGDFSMQSNTQLEIAEGSSLTLFLGGSFEQDSNTQMNNLSKKASNLVVLGTDSFNGQMQWNSNTQFWGAVYVPEANVDLNSNADFFGAIIGKSVNSISSNARIHYDVALSDSIVDFGGDYPYVVKSWQEKVSVSH
jgi:hypothetical protein